MQKKLEVKIHKIIPITILSIKRRSQQTLSMLSKYYFI